jgi:hypothetical protein
MDTTLGTMPVERAREIVSACLRNAMGRMGLGEDSPLPDCSLEEMLIANRILSGPAGESEEKTNPDGSKSYSIAMTVADRGIAAAFALENFGGDPRALLEALGFTMRRPDDDEEDEDAA